MTAIAVAIASSVMLTLGGCASSAGIGASARPIEPSSVGLAAGPVLPSVAPDWWRGFGDATLNDIVERALVSNPGLKVAQARIDRAGAAVAGAEAVNGVHVDAQLDAKRQRFSANSIYPPPLGGGTFTLGTAQIGAAYEFDLFGRHRAVIEAAIGTRRAAEADAQAARLLLAGNVARTYVQVGRLLAQREVAQRALQQRDEILTLIRQRVSGGLDSSVELRRGEGALPESRQQIEQIDEQIALARHALAALTAQPPDAFDALPVALRTVHAAPLPDQLPADLLGRRADISAARWRIEAATGNVRRAEAAFYPNVNLSAFVGVSSIGLDRLLRSGSAQYGAGPALTLPIFDAGRLRAELRGSSADLDAAIESYNGAVIDAIHDVSDQVSSVRSVARQQVEQAAAHAAAEAAYDFASQRYRAGLGNYLTVLNAEAALLNQRRLAVDLKARALDGRIELIRALGGGYTDADDGRHDAFTTPGKAMLSRAH